MTIVESAQTPSVPPFQWTARVVAQLAVLAVAAYVYVVAELAPIGAMPAIASSLHVSEADVGMLTAAYAFITVVTTLPLVRYTAHWPRRRVFVLTLTCLTVSQALSVIASTLTMLVACRVLCAVTHGLMWATIIPIAARLVPATHTGRATTAICAGTSVALVLGNPMTASMSQAWGWRPAVAVTAIAAAAITVLARLILPPMTVYPVADDALAKTTVPWRNTRLRLLCAFTLVGVTAQFASYTYIVAVVRDIAGIHGGMQSAVLAAYGIAGLLTMTMLARSIDHRPRTAATGALTALCLAFWFLSALTIAGIGALGAVLGIAAVIVWGASAAALPPMLQSAAIRTSPDPPEQASAFYVMAFQVGIVAGSIAGGFIYAHCGIMIVVATSSVLFGIALGGALRRPDVFGPPVRTDPRTRAEVPGEVPVNIPSGR